MEPYIHTLQVAQSCAVYLESDILEEQKVPEERRQRGKSTDIKNKEKMEVRTSESDEEEKEELKEKPNDEELKKKIDKKIDFMALSPDHFYKKHSKLGLSLGRSRAYSSQVDFNKPENGSTAFPSTSINSTIMDALGPKQEVRQKKQDSENEIKILPNQKTTLIFQFLFRPEYIGVGNQIVINMDNLKAFGKITKLISNKVDPGNSGEKSVSRHKNKKVSLSQHSEDAIVPIKEESSPSKDVINPEKNQLTDLL